MLTISEEVRQTSVVGNQEGDSYSLELLFGPPNSDMAPPDTEAPTPRPKAHRTPDTYDGKVPEDFPQWVSRFELIAKANSWGEGNELLGVMPIYLKDHAFNLYSTLSPATETDSYENLKTAMKKHLGIGENSYSWRLQLRQAKRAQTESNDAFAFRLSKLVEQAYPGDDPAAQERNVVEQFILGQKSDLVKYLLQDTIGTLAEIKDKAKRYEAAQELAGGARCVNAIEAGAAEASVSATQSSPGGKAELSNDMAHLISLIASGAQGYNREASGQSWPRQTAPDQRRCFKCDRTGHLAAQCQARRQVGSPTGACFNCGQPGHLRRDCPQRGNSIQMQTPRRADNGAACFQCGNLGHRAADCRTDVSKVCSYCQKKGHLIGDCRMKRAHSRQANAGPAANATPSKNDVAQAENGPTWN